MSKIRILPDILASQVAAGEVVERPASVVKELLENAVDAGAREVLVEVERGGSLLIRVTDDGCGMEKEDAMLSLERHATSKMRQAGDLHSIRTLGFRGEAIPSIASVSRFRMVTCEKGAVAGTELIVDGGKLKEVKDAGAAPGTMIEVKQLFFNVPARRKFLKAESTEAAHVEHEVRIHALAACQVRFRLRRDGNEMFDLPAVSGRGDRLRHLLGVETSAELIAVPLHAGNGFSVEGFLLPAAHARKGRRHQCVFLNGRPIEDAAISRGLAEGFKGGIVDGMHPAAWLWMEMEPELVDVNVHPAKREVRFHRPHEVRDAVALAVAQGLLKERRRNLAPPAEEAGLRGRQTIEDTPAAAGQIKSLFLRSPLPQENSPIPDPSLRSWLPPATQTDLSFPVADGTRPPHSVNPSGAASFRLLGVLASRFVVLESADGLVLFDPRAARERIVYERFLQGEQKGVETQGLLVPLLIELGPREHDMVMRNHDRFAAAGLELGDFGGGTLQLRSFPAFLQVADPRTFVNEVIDDCSAGGGGARIAYDRMARALAKRAGLNEMARVDGAMVLLDELFRCDLPYCAADGRPTLTEFSLRELERRFGNR